MEKKGGVCMVGRILTVAAGAEKNEESGKGRAARHGPRAAAASVRAFSLFRPGPLDWILLSSPPACLQGRTATASCSLHVQLAGRDNHLSE